VLVDSLPNSRIRKGASFAELFIWSGRRAEQKNAVNSSLRAAKRRPCRLAFAYQPSLPLNLVLPVWRGEPPNLKPLPKPTRYLLLNFAGTGMGFGVIISDTAQHAVSIGNLITTSSVGDFMMPFLAESCDIRFFVIAQKLAFIKFRRLLF